MNAQEFQGRVVLVAGAGRSLGQETAVAFAAHGARVACVDINPLALAQTLELVAKAGGEAREFCFDLAKQMPAEAMVNQVIEDFGRIDILINAAAVTPRTPLLEMDEWDWRRTLDVNLSAPFFTMQLVGRLMRRQGGGVMVNIISFESPAADQCASFASKAGLAALTQVAARELAPYGIRLNAVCPGVVEAGLAPAFQRTPVSDPFAGRAASAVDWVLYLCSPAASHLTGQVAAGSAITLSGGMNTPGVD